MELKMSLESISLTFPVTSRKSKRPLKGSVGATKLGAMPKLRPAQPPEQHGELLLLQQDLPRVCLFLLRLFLFFPWERNKWGIRSWYCTKVRRWYCCSTQERNFSTRFGTCLLQATSHDRRRQTTKFAWQVDWCGNISLLFLFWSMSLENISQVPFSWNLLSVLHLEVS